MACVDIMYLGCRDEDEAEAAFSVASEAGGMNYAPGVRVYHGVLRKRGAEYEAGWDRTHLWVFVFERASGRSSPTRPCGPTTKGRLSAFQC